MPTLEELFKNRELATQGGKTAEQVYDIQNSKDIPISSADPLVNTVGMSLARGSRNLLGTKKSETAFEQETTGIRIIKDGSQPIIYGSEIGRLTLKTTQTLSTMRTATSGELTDTDNLGGELTKLKNDTSNKLGLPTTPIPTYVVNQLNSDKYEDTNISDRMIQLGKIRGDAAGTLTGEFLKKNANGSLKTIEKQTLGGALKMGKQAVNKKLFGNGKRTGLNRKADGNSGTINPKSETTFTKDSLERYNIVGVNYGSNPDSQPATEPVDGNLDMNNTPYEKTINPEGETREDKNDLSYKQQISIPTISFSKEPGRVKTYSSKIDYNREIKKEDFLEAKRGMGTLFDRINQQNVFKGDTLDLGNGKTLDDYDFVPLKFTSIHQNKTAQFRATITGLSEDFSPSWDSGKFIGSPFSYHTYGGVERSVSFDFKVYSMNASEHKTAWDKINFLNSLVYPQGYYEGSSAAIPPFIKFTLGDMYSNQYAFIESLSNSFDENVPWNVTDKETTIGNELASTVIGKPSKEIDMRGYRLPMIANISVTIKFLESRHHTSENKFYSFEPQTK